MITTWSLHERSHDPYRVIRPFLVRATSEVVSLLCIFRVPEHQILPAVLRSTQSWDVWNFNTKQNAHLDSFGSLSGLWNAYVRLRKCQGFGNTCAFRLRGGCSSHRPWPRFQVRPKATARPDLDSLVLFSMNQVNQANWFIDANWIIWRWYQT